MIRKKLKVEAAWQSEYATWEWREWEDDNTPPNTIHLRAYVIRYEGKLIGGFDIAVVEEGGEGQLKAKIETLPEDIWYFTFGYTSLKGERIRGTSFRQLKVEEKLEVENPQRERGEALAKAIGRGAGGRTGQEQQGLCLGLLVELERHTQGLVEDGIDEVAAG